MQGCPGILPRGFHMPVDTTDSYEWKSQKVEKIPRIFLKVDSQFQETLFFVFVFSKVEKLVTVVLHHGLHTFSLLPFSYYPIRFGSKTRIFFPRTRPQDPISHNSAHLTGALRATTLIHFAKQGIRLDQYYAVTHPSKQLCCSPSTLDHRMQSRRRSKAR